MARLCLFSGLIVTISVALGQQAKRVDEVALKNAIKTGDDWLT